jgi:hypothetical protein
MEAEYDLDSKIFKDLRFARVIKRLRRAVRWTLLIPLKLRV